MDYIFSLGSIIFINLLLSGDNALVIALASRRLAPDQQRKAMLWGSGGAIILRIFLTFIAVILLKMPYLQMVGGLFLLWIACKLIADDKEHHEEVAAKNNLWDAVKTIIIADFIMSLDNVIAIAGAAKGNIALLIIGLAISIPIIVWGSKLIGHMMQKWPVIVSIGAAFLGWVAGEMAIADQKLSSLVSQYEWMDWGIPLIGALSVLIFGKVLLKNRNKARENG
jgi:YjbE family integral membrane protein